MNDIHLNTLSPSCKLMITISNKADVLIAWGGMNLFDYYRSLATGDVLVRLWDDMLGCHGNNNHIFKQDLHYVSGR